VDCSEVMKRLGCVGSRLGVGSAGGGRVVVLQMGVGFWWGGCGGGKEGCGGWGGGGGCEGRSGGGGCVKISLFVKDLYVDLV